MDSPCLENKGDVEDMKDFIIWSLWLMLLWVAKLPLKKKGGEKKDNIITEMWPILKRLIVLPVTVVWDVFLFSNSSLYSFVL